MRDEPSRVAYYIWIGIYVNNDKDTKQIMVKKKEDLRVSMREEIQNGNDQQEILHKNIGC